MTNKLVRHIVACWDSNGEEILVRYTTDVVGEEAIEKDLKYGLDVYGFELYPNINQALWEKDERYTPTDYFNALWALAYEPD